MSIRSCWADRNADSGKLRAMADVDEECSELEANPRAGRIIA